MLSSIGLTENPCFSGCDSMMCFSSWYSLSVAFPDPFAGTIPVLQVQVSMVVWWCCIVVMVMVVDSDDVCVHDGDR